MSLLVFMCKNMSKIQKFTYMFHNTRNLVLSNINKTLRVLSYIILPIYLQPSVHLYWCIIYIIKPESCMKGH